MQRQLSRMACWQKQRDDLLAFAWYSMRNWLRLPNGLILRSSSFGLSVYCIEENPPRLPTGLAGINSTINFRKVSSGPRSGKGGNATNTPCEFSGESQLCLHALFFLRRQLGPQYLALLRFFSTIAHLCAVNAPEWARVQPIDDRATSSSLARAFACFQRHLHPKIYLSPIRQC